jgi:hypothetical protein
MLSTKKASVCVPLFFRPLHFLISLRDPILLLRRVLSMLAPPT